MHLPPDQAGWEAGMIMKLIRFLAPVFSDPDQQRRAEILAVTQFLALTMISAVVVFAKIESPEHQETLLQGGLGITAMLVSYLLLRSGRIEAASWMIVIPGWVIFTLDLALYAGIRGVSVLGQILMVIFIGLAVNGWTSLLLTIFTLTANFIILRLEQSGVLVQAVPLGATETRWFIQTAYAILAAIYVWTTDNVLRAAVNESRETADQYRALFEQTSDGVVIMGLDWKIITANSQAHQMLGHELGALQGHEVTEHDFQDPETMNMRRNQVLEGLLVPAFEEYLLGKDGSWFPVEINLALVKDAHGKPQHIQCILRDITARKDYENRLQHQALHDPLTDLPNRILFDSRYQEAYSRADDDQSQVAVLFVDLDNFKSVNDEFGHAVGDQVLQQLGSRLLRSIRETDTVARLGGDEFVIILENIHNKDDVEKIAGKLIQTIALPVDVDSGQVEVTASIGINICERSDLPQIDLVKTSDSAMYLVKEQGKNAFRFYNPEPDS